MGYIYTAHYGNGLLLNSREYRNFLRRYYRRNGLTEEKIAKSYIEYVGIQNIIQTENGKLARKALDKFGYITSNFSGYDIALNVKNRNLRFPIVEVKPTRRNPITFLPYKINNQSTDFYEHYHIYEKRYIAFCDTDIDGCELCCYKTDASYDNFVAEFKRKFKNYLPDDFDWESHLGRVNWVEVNDSRLKSRACKSK